MASSADPAGSQAEDSQGNQSEDIEAALKVILPKPYTDMHKPMEGLPNFERELRKRLWCILWTWDWQMSTLLSRPLLIDQDDHKLEIPNGRLENINDPEIPHPLASVALQAELGLHVSHLFQKMSTDYSIQLVLETENELEKWMGTFPAALRDHRPDTRWDKKHPNIPFMRCQLNIIAYAYLLAPLKPYLLSTADPNIMSIQLGADLRNKAVDTCLDLMRTSEQFYELIFPASIKYFFIIFFMFDAATVMCSAIVHDVDYTLPKRNQCIRSLRTAQELMDGVAHLSESARLSALLLPPPDIPAEPDWLFMDYGAPAGLSITNTAAQPQPQQQPVVAMNPGDPLSGTFLEPLWDWDRLNLDLGQYAVPQYATSGSWI
ncbi:hypothetical protein SLS53_004432 [Cytospora paraplurivora]|uniref:Xylanolytic transcriptional activator regulatory domain-containing protein n=1 Tax=Cytospora paraplurivora TaxID=2898453 RepID=A0AAN9UAP0_9PEZI